MTVKSRDRLALGALLPAAIGVMVVAAGWWVAIVSLVAADRRYIGGSLGNSGLGLTLGYNSFGRLTGDETGSVGGGRGGYGGGLRAVDGQSMGGSSRRRRSRRGWRRTTPLRRSAAPPSTTSPPEPPPLSPITASAMIGPVPWSGASR